LFLFFKEKLSQLIFPKSCIWYSYETFELIEGNRITAEYNGGRTRVYFRGGGIISVKSQIRKSARLMFDEPFSLIVCLDDFVLETNEISLTNVNLSVRMDWKITLELEELE
jgi:alpha-glucosidase (family GH31 glycosyl hydrolase)